MPVRRSALHERAGSEDFVMAWVSVPDLRVHASPQRYEHVRPGVVRYVSLDGDFTAELEVDADGLVVRYPRLAERVGAGPVRCRSRRFAALTASSRGGSGVDGRGPPLARALVGGARGVCRHIPDSPRSSCRRGLLSGLRSLRPQTRQESRE